MKTKRLICLMLCALFTASLALPAAAATDTAAEYTIPRTPEFIAGDVDCSGQVDAADARLALRMAVRLDEIFLYSYHMFADMSGDGKVTSADARSILRVAVGLDAYQPLPADSRVYQLRASGFSFDSDQLGTLKALQCNAQAQTGYLDAELPMWRIGSEADMAAWIAAFLQEDPKVRLNDAAGTEFPSDPKILALARRYDKAFYETYDLFICYFEQGSGSFRQAVYPPAVQNGVLTLPVGSVYYLESAFTDDMAYRFLFIPVLKEKTKDCTSFTCKRAEVAWLDATADIGAYYNAEV